MTVIANGAPITDPEEPVIDGPSVNPDAEASGTLPVLCINVYQYDEGTKSFILDGDGNKMFENEVIDKDLSHKNYFHGEYWLDVNGCQWLIISVPSRPALPTTRCRCRSRRVATSPARRSPRNRSS